MNAPISYKPLPTVLKRQGFLYRQVFREGDWAIYEQFTKAPEKSRGFELAHIRRHNGFSLAGKTFPPAETYPTSNMWGSHGWTYDTFEAAMEKLREKRIEAGEVASIVEDQDSLEELAKESSDEDIATV